MGFKDEITTQQRMGLEICRDGPASRGGAGERQYVRGRGLHVPRDLPSSERCAYLASVIARGGGGGARIHGNGSIGTYARTYVL